MPSLAAVRQYVAAALAIPSVLLAGVGSAGCLWVAMWTLLGSVFPADIVSNFCLYLVVGAAGVLVSALVSEV